MLVKEQLKQYPGATVHGTNEFANKSVPELQRKNMASPKWALNSNHMNERRNNHNHSIGACGGDSCPVGAWVGSRLMRAKYQDELDQLRAEMKDKLAEVKSHELENVRKASDILMESIVPPLKAEIINLRNDVQRLNKALERIWGCPHVDCCPVKYELLLHLKAVEQSRTEATAH